ncbi:MAG TPA: ammonium transporter, partial [Dehalococcoidia bacterium]|nr:ammonium transporter [Dehalococcoidia bacterium]
MSNSFSGVQKVAALAVITLIALFFAAHFAPGDAGGTNTGNAINATTYSGNGGGSFSADCQAAATQQDAAKCAQANVGALADQVGHNKIAVNFAWTLIMGSFVLFMQAGFALLTTGLTRAKNAGHMMMLNFAAFVIAWIAYFAIGFAFQFGGVGSTASAPGNLGGAMVLGHLLTVHGTSWGLLGTNGFFLMSGHAYDVGALALFFFEVVFMET